MANNPWLQYVAEFRKENPTMKYSDVLREASKYYKKVDVKIPKQKGGVSAGTIGGLSAGMSAGLSAGMSAGLSAGGNPVSPAVLLAPQIIEVARESGLLSATSKTLDVLTGKLEYLLSNDGQLMRKLMKVPTLQRRVDDLIDTYNIKSHRWLDFRKENTLLRIEKLKNEIKQVIEQSNILGTIKGGGLKGGLSAGYLSTQSTSADVYDPNDYIPKKKSSKLKGGVLVGGNVYNLPPKLFLTLSSEAYKKPADRLKKVSEFTLLENQYTNTDVATYINTEKKILIFSYRGTKPTNLTDLGNDAFIAVGRPQSAPRFKTMEKMFREADKEYPDYRFIFTGHSLGGTLGWYIMKICRELNQKHECSYVIYNRGSSPLESFEKGPVDNLKHHWHAKGDLVSQPFLKESVTNHHVVNKKVFIPHLLANFD